MIATDQPRFNIKVKLPSALLYDIIDGEAYYRQDYKSVLNNTKTLEEIMGCSSFQWTIIEYLLELLFTLKTKKIIELLENPNTRQWYAINDSILLLEGIEFNIGNNLKEQGIEVQS